MSLRNRASSHAPMGILVAVLMYSLVELIIKRLLAHYPLQQVVLLRMASSLPLLAVAYWTARGGVPAGWSGLLKTRRPALHLLRCLLGALAMAFIFHAVGTIPLGTAAALTSTAPLFLLLMSPALLKEPVSRKRWLGVLVGFAGVVVVTGPQATTAWLGLGSALLGALCSAGVMVCLRLVAVDEDPRQVTLLNALGMTVLALMATGLWGWKSLQGIHWLDVLVLGLLGSMAHLISSWAYRHGSAGSLAPLGFTACLWAALFGLVLWGEVPDLGTLLGIAAIVTGGWWATRSTPSTA